MVGYYLNLFLNLSYLNFKCYCKVLARKNQGAFLIYKIIFLSSYFNTFPFRLDTMYICKRGCLSVVKKEELIDCFLGCVVWYVAPSVSILL